MIATPTDDELLAAARELDVTQYEVDLPYLRLVIEAPTLAGAMRAMSYAPDSEEGRRKCLALRRRFPQPITDAVLRAAGFDPCATFDGDWVQAVSNEIVAFYRSRTGTLSWFRQQKTRDGLTKQDRVDLIENVRTPDSLHRVVECLRGLYREEG